MQRLQGRKITEELERVDKEIAKANTFQIQ